MFFKLDRENKIIDKIYEIIVNCSREKIYYTKFKVPDTIDGRFDMLMLFSILIIFKLSKLGDNGKNLSQKLFDRIFKDMDYSLREMGAGDVGVSTKIKKMASAFMGRQKVYCAAFSIKDKKMLKISINDNVFRNTDIDENILNSLATYILECLKYLDNEKEKLILSGKFRLPKFK